MVGKRRTRRLHYLGACHRVPGIDYLDYEELGPHLPSEDAYVLVCKNCWAGQVAGLADEEAEITSDEEADSVATDRE